MQIVTYMRINYALIESYKRIKISSKGSHCHASGITRILPESIVVPFTVNLMIVWVGSVNDKAQFAFFNMRRFFWDLFDKTQINISIP